jgi:hypothetical protein
MRDALRDALVDRSRGLYREGMGRIGRARV